MQKNEARATPALEFHGGRWAGHPGFGERAAVQRVGADERAAHLFEHTIDDEERRDDTAALAQAQILEQAGKFSCRAQIIDNAEVGRRLAGDSVGLDVT